MRKSLLTMAALACLCSLAACFEDEHGHDHAQDSDHSHNTPDHHNSIN